MLYGCKWHGSSRRWATLAPLRNTREAGTANSNQKKVTTELAVDAHVFKDDARDQRSCDLAQQLSHATKHLGGVGEAASRCNEAEQGFPQHLSVHCCSVVRKRSTHALLLTTQTHLQLLAPHPVHQENGKQVACIGAGAAARHARV